MQITGNILSLVDILLVHNGSEELTKAVTSLREDQLGIKYMIVL